MKKIYWVLAIFLIVLVGLGIKLVNLSRTIPETIETISDELEETVEEERDMAEENAAFIDVGTDSVEGVSLESLELSTELAITDCGSINTSMYTVTPSSKKSADGSIEYTYSYQYQTIENFGSGTSTIDIYDHNTEEFYSPDYFDYFGMNREWYPGEWEWKLTSDSEDPVLSAKLSAEADINDEFSVIWTLIAQGEETNYSQSVVKPSKCSDGSLYISSPFTYEMDKLSTLPDDAERFFQVKVFYKDKRLDATTLSF